MTAPACTRCGYSFERLNPDGECNSCHANKIFYGDDDANEH